MMCSFVYFCCLYKKQTLCQRCGLAFLSKDSMLDRSFGLQKQPDRVTSGLEEHRVMPCSRDLWQGRASVRGQIVSAGFRRNGVKSAAQKNSASAKLAERGTEMEVPEPRHRTDQRDARRMSSAVGFALTITGVPTCTRAVLVTSAPVTAGVAISTAVCTTSKGVGL